MMLQKTQYYKCNMYFLNFFLRADSLHVLKGDLHKKKNTIQFCYFHQRFCLANHYFQRMVVINEQQIASPCRGLISNLHNTSCQNGYRWISKTDRKIVYFSNYPVYNYVKKSQDRKTKEKITILFRWKICLIWDWLPTYCIISFWYTWVRPRLEWGRRQQGTYFVNLERSHFLEIFKMYWRKRAKVGCSIYLSFL